MVDGLVLRTIEHQTQLDFSNHSSVPVINGLSNKSHPCQILADLLTYYEEKGSIKGKKIAYSKDFGMSPFWNVELMDKDVILNVENTVKLLEDLGAYVEEIDINWAISI